MLQLVNKSQARRLKKLGFDWKVKNLFIGQSRQFYLSDKMDIEENWNKFDYTLSRPTVAESLEWLRIHLGCKCEIVIKDWEKNRYSGLYYFKNMDTPTSIREYIDREKAESELLTRVLEYKFIKD